MHLALPEKTANYGASLAPGAAEKEAGAGAQEGQAGERALAEVRLDRRATASKALSLMIFD